MVGKLERSKLSSKRDQPSFVLLGRELVNNSPEFYVADDYENQCRRKPAPLSRMRFAAFFVTAAFSFTKLDITRREDVALIFLWSKLLLLTEWL